MTDDHLEAIGRAVLAQVRKPEGVVSIGDAAEGTYKCWCPICGDPDERWAPGPPDYWHTDNCQLAKQLNRQNAL